MSSLYFVEHPAEPSIEQPSVLVLLHGLGSNEMDLVAVAPEIDPRLHIFSLRAPYESGYGGYSWFRVEFRADGSRDVDGEQALSSRDEVARFITELPGRLGYTPQRMLLGGFSQGAMISAGVALARPQILDGALVLSGLLLPHFENTEQTSRPLPILVQHGISDPVLPVEEGRRLSESLQQTGHEVTYKEYRMGHQVSLESLFDVRHWVSRVLQG